MLRYSFVLFSLALYACKEVPSSGGIAKPQETVSQDIKSNETWREEFFRLVNQHRRDLGLSAVVPSESLSAIAQIHSEDMANGHVAFGHTGFSERCADSREALGGGNWCAENVASGQDSPKAVFSSWLNSSGHKANIESVKSTHSGLGHERSLSGKIYWTQLFLEL